MQSPYVSVLPLFPPPLRGALQKLPPDRQAVVEEIRLRVGAPLCVVMPSGAWPVDPGRPVSCEDLEMILEAATQGSIHAMPDFTHAGFVTVKGGHRLGLCGAVVSQGGRVSALRHPSSLCLRLARSIYGAADSLLPQLMRGKHFCHTLILSPPGLGKTTLLRDLIRQVSDGGSHGAPCRVSLVDERGEVAGCYQGQPQLPVGAHTDVLDGCPKAEGVIWMLRGMGPQVLAMDEITAPEDVRALQNAAGCGVVLLATAHANCLADLVRRPLYRILPQLFDKAVLIRLRGGRRFYEVHDFAQKTNRGCSS